MLHPPFQVRHAMSDTMSRVFCISRPVARNAADTHSGTDRATYFRRCSNGCLPRYAFLATLTQSSDLKSADNSQAHSNRDWFSLAQV